MRSPLPAPGRLAAAATIVVAVLVAFAGEGVAQRAAAHLGLRAQGNRPSATTFRIAGRLALPAYPGRFEALDLKLTNAHRHALRVSRITIAVAVDAKHAKAGCIRRRDVHTIRMPRSSYPLVLPPRRSRRLRALGVVVLPRIGLNALPVSQDACKGARFSLRFAGRASRVRAKR